MSSGISAEQWLGAASHRRSVYALADTSVVSDDRVADIVRKVLSFAPSAYNTQTARITLVQGEKHRMFWDVIIETAKPILQNAGDHVWNAMSAKYQAYKGAHGSVVFWESTDAIKAAGEKHKSSAHVFGEWSEHGNAMHQLLVWTALELEGVGANLQHLNSIPAVEAAVKTFLGVPDDYKLKAHLNYGDEAREHPAVPKKLPFDETLRIVR